MDLTAQHFCTSHFLQPVAADMWQSTSNSVVATSGGAVDDERHGFSTFGRAEHEFRRKAHAVTSLQRRQPSIIENL
jgi:hypothetical protein